MSFFGKILDKLGLRKEKEEPVAAAPAPAAKPSAPAQKPAVAPAAKPATPAPKPAPAAARPATPAAKPHDYTKDVEVESKREAPAAPKPISEVDVVKQLDELARGKNLNWKVSIVDLLKLLDLDSSYEARVELAKELDCPPELMNDSAKMNTWLHKTVLKKIAENGGNIPRELLD